MLLASLKPYGRAIKFWRLQRQAERIAAQASPADRDLRLPPIAFLIGCGRSGTTILGHIFSQHPQVCSLIEPEHFWAAIDPRCDASNFYHCIDACMLMDAQHATAQACQRFNRFMHTAWQPTGATLLLEKTPHNAMRIGYLEALAANAKFIHIVRDGADVARSLAPLATHNTYRVAGMPSLNQWWGVAYNKWHVLAHDGAAAGYFPDEVTTLTDEVARGVYEWLVFRAEVERWRTSLGQRLYELTYPHLTLHPTTTLRALCDFLDIAAPTAWQQRACAVLHAPRCSADAPVVLPPSMATAFNRWQTHFGFAHRAVAAT